ncbi:EAL domain-containing protein [Ornithinibacillus xuwenensis]|uniref:EAL domain-containing protein n=1 Tax=Ornithinibacillus xuwenensis TaxID=3144668 RepID=A0ABU9XK13_9BACI
MHCKSCLIEGLEYEIRFEGNHNQSVIPNIINHLNRRKIDVKVQDNLLFIKEMGVNELIDFCRDHMQLALVYFRLPNQEWKPLSTIQETLDMQWIDEVIKKKQLTCYFQPIVDERENIFAYEILSRFVKEDGTLIYPDVIFEAARKRGRLYALDRLCRLTAVKSAAKIKDKKVFINFIPTSIYSPEFCLQSTTRLANTLGINPSQLCFEVVETERVDDVNHLKEILSYYKEKGFEYALDDVGEGYNTIEMIEDITPHYMKLDMQFVQGVAVDFNKQQVAKSMLRKSIELGSIPLAEGIESKEDFEWLKREGYKLFQGYLFGKPTPEIDDVI